MSDDGFVELTRYASGHKNEGDFVSVNERGSTLISRSVLMRLGRPQRLVIQANPNTGDVRLIPTDSPNGNSVKVTHEGQFTNRLTRFCSENGFAFGRNPAEIKDGMVVFRLQRKAE